VLAESASSSPSGSMAVLLRKLTERTNLAQFSSASFATSSSSSNARSGNMDVRRRTGSGHTAVRNRPLARAMSLVDASGEDSSVSPLAASKVLAESASSNPCGTMAVPLRKLTARSNLVQFSWASCATNSSSFPARSGNMDVRLRTGSGHTEVRNRPLARAMSLVHASGENSCCSSPSGETLLSTPLPPMLLR